MRIAALIAVMIGIVVGVNLISPISSVVNDVENGNEAVITEEIPEEESAAVSSLMTVLPIIMVTVILLGAVAMMGFSSGSGTARRGGSFVIKLFGAFGSMRNSTYTKKYYEDRSIYSDGDIFANSTITMKTKV